MPINGKVKEIYDTLKGGGADVGTEQEFNEWFFAKGDQGYKNRKSVYDTLKGGGADAGANYEEFAGWLGLHAVKPVRKPSQAQPAVNRASTPPVATSTRPVRDNKPQQGWQPTWQEKMGMQMQLDETMRQVKHSQQDFNTRMENMRKARTPGKTSEVKFNPESGKMERRYYTTHGDEVATPLEQSRLNLQYRDEWEATTEEGRRHREKRMENDFERRVGASLDKYDPDNAAATVWQQAEDRSNEEMGRYLEERSKPSWSNFVRGAAEGMSVTGGLGADNVETGIKAFATHLKYHDLQRMADDAWNMLGKEKQQSIIEDMYSALKNRYPQATEQQLQQAAREMAREQSDRRMYELAVAKNAPKDAAEYFIRKVAAGNALGTLMQAAARAQAGTTGDWAAREDAEQRFEKEGHKVAGIAGTVTGFALDPLTWASAGAGGAAVKGSTWLGGKLIGEAAMRKFGTTLGGRMLGGAIGGAVNFGTYEAGSEALDQMKWGGYIDEETGKRKDGFSLGNVARRAGHGLMMGAVTGVIAPYLGNVSDKLVRATESTVGKMGIRAGELGVGTVAEGTIFAVPEIIDTYGQYGDLINSLSDESSPNYIADEQERAAKIEELRNSRGDAMMDVWTDNMAMIAGFKAQHILKSAPRVIRELARSKNGKAGFETRLRSILDGRGDLALTEDEKTELERRGYGDLKDLTEEYSRYADAKEEYDKARPSTTDASRMIEGGDGQAELPYNRFVELMTDNSVSEAARAKMYYYLTGHGLPMSTVMGSSVLEDKDADGNVTGYTVQSFGANGVITSRTFGDKKRADVEVNRINRQAELNGFDVGERYYDWQGDNKRMYEACESVAEETGAPANLLFDLMKRKTEAMNDVEREWAEKILDAYNGLGDKYGSSEVRTAINEEFGVDVDKAIRKERNRRSEQEQKATREYANRLFADVKRKQEEAAERGEAPVDPDAPASDSRIAALLGIDDGEQGDPVSTAFNRGHEADAQERQDIAIELSDPNNAEAQEAWNGVVQRINEDAAYMVAQQRERWKQMRHTDGSLRPATLKEKDDEGHGKQVYVVDGIVEMMPDGSMVDPSKSDKIVVVFDPSTGERKMIDPTADTGISTLGEVTTAEQLEADIERSRQEWVQAQIDEAQGTVRLVPGAQLVLPTGEEAVVVATDADGENITVRLGDGTQASVQRSELQRVRDEQAMADYRRRHGQNGPDGSDGQNGSDGWNGGVVAGAPADYTADMELTIRDEDGSEKPAMVMGRVRAVHKNGRMDYVPDADGNLIEYLMDGDVHRENEDKLASKVVSHVAPQQPEAPAQAQVVNDGDGTVEYKHEDLANGTSRTTARGGLETVRSRFGGTLSTDGEKAMAEARKRDERMDAERERGIVENQSAFIRRAAEGIWNRSADAGAVSRPGIIDDQMEYLSGRVRAEQAEAERREQERERRRMEEALKMPMVEVKGKLKPDWSKATPVRAHAYLYNERGLSRENADAFVENNRKAAASELEKLRGKRPKMGTDLDEFDEKTAEWQAKMDELQRRHDYWQAVKDEQRRVLEAEAVARAERDAVLHDEAVAAERADYEARKRAEAERRAVGNGNPMPAITEKWNNAAKIDGHRDEIMLPDGTSLKGHYVLHESGASSPSHNPETWQKTDGFPMDANGGSVNDRDYERDRDAQEHTRSIARRYDQRALQSVPVVSNDGVVLSGNGRTMAGELAARDNTDGAYVSYLREYAPKFGFTAEQVDGMQHPRVSFVPDEAMPYTAETFARFNQQEMKSQNKTEQAVKLGKTVGDGIFRRIVRAINGYDTLGDFYNDAEASLGAVYDLHSAGVIPQAQLAEMVDGVRGQEKLSAVGREFLENMLIGKAFESDPEVVRMLTAEPSMRRTVITALGEIVDNIALGGEWSLQGALADAVKLCFDARQGGARYGEIVSVFARQGVLFADPDELQTVADFNNATMLMLADVLNDKRVTLLKTTVQLYNDRARDAAAGQADLFAGGIESREDILRDVINFINENYGKRKEIEAARASAVERRKAERAGHGGEGQGVQQDGTSPAVNSGSADTESKRRLADSRRDVERGEGLSEEEADDLILASAERAIPMPDFEFTPENWKEEFGDGRLQTPVEEIKIGENQFSKMIDKGREKEAGLIKPTFTDPDFVIEEASEAVDGTTERASSHLYVKSFIGKDGKKRYFFKSVTVKRDGLEVNVSSHFDRPKRLREALKKGKLLYRFDGGAQTEQTPASVSVTTSRTYPGVSADKDTESSANIQENSGENAENQIPDGVQAALAAAERETDTEPTEAQKEAGNYKKGHVKIDGYDVTIEQPKGSVRRGKDASGKRWEQEMHNTYGYIRGTEGVDGDHIDVFLSDNPSQGDVFVVDQVNEDGSFDEHKVMYGFPDIESARKAYLSNYEDGWQGLGTITQVSKDEFKKWIRSSRRKTKPFADYRSVKKEAGQNEGQPSKPTVKEGEDFVSAAVRIAKENEVRRTAAHFPQETADEAAAFDKRVPEMEDAELLAYMQEDGKGDVNKAHHPSVYDEYDYRHGDEQLQSYDDTLVRLKESGTTLEQADEMLANLQKDTARLATDERAELLGQEEALQEYIAGLENEVSGHDLQEPVDSLGALQGNGKSYDENAYDAYLAGRRFGNDVDEGVSVREAIDLAHKMVSENDARGGLYILPFLDGVGDGVDLRHGKHIEEAKKREAEYRSRKETAGSGVAEAPQQAGPAAESGNRIEQSTEPQPIGRSRFGNVYDQFRRKPMEALAFLLKHRSGDLRGVFYREGIGDIDLVWGNEERSEGVHHILEKHVNRLKDFASIEDAISVIDDVIQNGHVVREKWDKITIEKDGYRVGISKNLRDDDGNIIDGEKRWVVTAFDNSKTQKEKETSAATRVTPNSNKGGRAVTSDASSANKDTESSSNAQGSVNKSSSEGKIEDVGEVLAGARKDMRREDELSEALDELLAGILGEDYSTDWLEGQRVLDADRQHRSRLMGSRVEKRKAHIASELQGRNLTDEQQAVVDVFTGKKNNQRLVITGKDGKERRVVMRQGNEQGAGTKHSIFGHYGTTSNGYTADELLLIPDIIKNGERYQTGGKVAYEIVRNGVTYTVTTEQSKTGLERFTNFFTNKKPAAVLNGSLNTDEQHEPQQSVSGAKLQKVSEKDKEESLKIFDAAKSRFGTTTDLREAGYILPDGTLLDFSGRHQMDEGMDTSSLRGQRSVDHRDVKQLNYEADGNTPSGMETSMPDFIERGAIRIDCNAGTINLSVAPTAAQKTILRRLIARNEGAVSVDFGNGWDSDHYAEYDEAKPQRVLGDIDRYFDEGIKPTGDYEEGAMFFRTADGAAYGFTLNGKIYIDPRIATSETRVHEYHHLWSAALERANPDAWSHLKSEIFEKDDLRDYVLGLYPELAGDEDALVHEMFSWFGGKRGAERLRSEEARMERENKAGMSGLARIKAMFAKLRGLLHDYWQMARDLFAGNNARLKETSVEDFADMAMADLLHGVDPREKGGVRFMRDADYMDAVEKGDAEKAGRMVREAAKRAGVAVDANGNPIDLYHGTRHFGFTVFDRGKSKLGFFFSTLRSVAGNYGTHDMYAGVRRINKPLKDDGSAESVLHNARSVFSQDWRMATDEEKEAIISKTEAEAKEVAEKLDEYKNNISEDLPEDDEIDILNATGWVEDLFYTAAYAKENGNEGAELYRLVSEGAERYDENRKEVREYLNKHYDELDESQREYLNYLLHWNSGDVAIDIAGSYARALSGEDVATVTGSSFLTVDELRDNVERTKDVGAYHAYGKLGDKPLVVDAHGHSWVSFFYNGKLYDTDKLAEEAEQQGYTSVIVKNVHDDGDLADDYIFFNSNQIKSADPVTYDDAGNVIPLSERFNPEKKDIRFMSESVDDGRTEGVNSVDVRQVAQQMDDRNGTEVVRFVDFLRRGRLEQGESRYFHVGETGDILNEHGISGKITIGTSAVNSHHNEDADHLDENDWVEVIEKINEPVAITEYGDRGNSYRIYTIVEKNGKNICVGVDVNSVGRDVNITNIRTAFARDIANALNERLVYPHSRTELETAIRELSLRHNREVYPEQPFDAANIQNNSDIAKENGENVTEDTAKYRIREDEPANVRHMMQEDRDMMRSAAEQMGEKLHTPIHIIEDVNEITHPNAAVQEQRRGSKGWYDKATRQVNIVLVNNRDIDDVKASVAHETIAHKGLRELVGEERYDEFLDETYQHLRDDLKKGVDDAAGRLFLSGLNGLNGQSGLKGRSYEDCRRTAVDELFGRLAEKPFEEFSEGERTLWQKIKATVRRLLDKFLGSLKLPKWFELGDNELRYMLWRSKERLERGKEHPIDLARDIVKREELGLTDEARYNMGDAPEVSSMSMGDIILTNFHRAVSGELRGKPVAIGRITKDGKEYLERLSGLKMKDYVDFVLNPSDMVHIYNDHYGANEKDPGNNVPLTDDDIRNMADIIATPDSILFGKEDMSGRNVFFFFKKNADGTCNLAEVYGDRKGNLTAKSFYNTKKEATQRVMEIKKSLLPTSVTYSGATPSVGAKIPNLFETKAFTDKNNSEKGDLYRDSDETEDIWNDQSLGLQERITAAATRLANNHRDDKTLRNDAMRAIGDNLADLAKSMLGRPRKKDLTGAERRSVDAKVGDAAREQKRFDMTTVKRVSDLARVLISSGYLNNLTAGEVKRLLSAVKNSVAHDDIEGDVQKVMDIMVDNQLKHAEDTLHELEAIRGSKVDARGVEVQGELDPAGAHTMKVFKKTRGWEKADIEEALSEAQQRMGSSDVAVADEAALEYTGLQLALEYAETIKDSKVEERKLRDEIKQAHDETSERDRLTDSYRQYIASLRDAIRENKIERILSYYGLVGRLTDSLRESLANAKAFKEAEKQRIREIQHNANSDMEGRPSDEHYKPTFADKFVNNSFVSFLFAPLATFDQMLRMFGGKSANGEGYLYNRFMRGWVDARQKEINGVREKYAILDRKAAELFGGKVKTWGDLIRRVGKLPKGTVSFWNGGEMQERELTQGNLMYIYMVNKMLDGRMKLRKMGITEENVSDIEEVLDPRLIELADWLQDEFLVETRNEYNETHKRMFGASMAAIEHYFPLMILANARADKPEDLDNPDKSDGISTATGSIIKRRRNALALDITGADALHVILDHVAQMEHWNAYAEFNRDLNTLRTYKRFRNQVQNMTTIYGNGEELWKKFNDVCQMAAGTYRPPRTKLDKGALEFAQGVTAAKVSFRMFTALKQFLSMPAYIPEARADYLAANILNPAKAWKWSMEHLPIFSERWRSRVSGDPRLAKSGMDWRDWRATLVQRAARWGMSPNAFVDALTVSIGAHSMYQTRLAQYLRDGYSEADAEKKAVQDAEVLYNQTQQSSEGAFTSTMQVDRSWLSVLFTVFRNASMSYQRQLHDALRNFKHNLTPGGRARSIEFMTKQLLRDKGIEPQRDGNWSDADWHREEQVAKRKFRRQLLKDTLRVATFGYIMQLAWNLGAYLPYLLFGDDEDEKQQMWDDVWAHTAFGSVEGLTGGDLMSQAGDMLLTGEGNPAYLSKDMPLTSDIMTAFQKLGNGQHTEALNDMINLIVQAGLGVNPQSITDVALSIMDACGDDPALAHEATICVSRILQVPQSQIDKMYFDEVGLSGDEVSKYTPEQLAERYAQFKVKRGRFFSPWSWGDEERIKKYTDKANKTIKERTEQMGDEKVNEAYLQYEEVYKGVDAKVKEAKKTAKTDYVESARLMADAHSDPNAFATYQTFKQLDGNFTKIVKSYLGAKTADEAALYRQAVLDYKAAMVKVLDAPDAATRAEAMVGLGKVMRGLASAQSNR